MTEPTTEPSRPPAPLSRTTSGAVLPSTDPVLLLIGSSMDAAGFGTLAQYFTDRTVVTYDPRGSERSTRTDGAMQNMVEEHADDLHRLISAIDAGPVDIFASSGGAVNALALVAEHPEQVRTLIAHETAAHDGAPRSRAGAGRGPGHPRDLHAQRAGRGMTKFVALTSHKGEVPADWLDRPAPGTPSTGGGPATGPPPLKRTGSPQTRTRSDT